MHRLRCLPLLLALLLPVMISGCSKAAKKDRALERADAYFKEGEYDKARLEYTNVLRAEPQNTVAIQQLGLVWSELGSPLRALPFLLKARELVPANVAVHTKLAFAFMSVGQVAEARKEALAILKLAPTHDDAIRLLADTALSETEITETEAELQKLPDPKGASFHLATAILSTRKKDIPAAEAALQKALELEPKSSSVHLAMGSFYLFRNNTAKAGEEFKLAADLAPIRSTARLKNAEFKLQAGAVDEAKAALKEVTDKAPDYLPAWGLLAQIAMREQKFDEAQSLLENIFGRDSGNYDARLLQAQVSLAKGDVKKAVSGLEQMNSAYPKSPPLLHRLGQAYVQSGNLTQAESVLQQAVGLNPMYDDAVMLLAEINLRSGEPKPVVDAMQDLLKRQPHSVQAQLLLADAYRAVGQLDNAAEVLRGQIKVYPKSSQPHLLLGLIQREQGKLDETRKSFEKGLELSPDSLTLQFQLLDLDIQEKNFAAGLQRAKSQMEKSPKSAPAQFMEARVYAAQRDWDHAEAALLKTLELDPNFSTAYDTLIAVYVETNKLPAAIARLEAQIAKNPDDARALMLSGMIFDQMKEYAKAADAYQKLLVKNPDFAAALNNLAYLNAEHLHLPDKAFDLATKARALQPTDPSIADTLGWAFYKRGDYQQALALIQEAAAKIANNAEIQFHLGMANYMMGRTDVAKASLEKAMAAAGSFPGKDQIPARLALLEADPAKSAELSVEDLEKLLKDQSNDVILQLRLGEAYEKAGASAKAVVAFEEAYKLNPKLPTPALKLAQLYAGSLNQKDKALEFARKARDLAPTDPQTAAILGGIAFQNGDLTWSYGLLQESVRHQPDDAQTLYSFAWAAYSQGKVGDARQSMQRVLTVAPDFNKAEDARSFLAMTAGLDQKEIAAAASEAQSLLKTDPGYVPALMVQGVMQEQQGEVKQAVETYTKVLGRFQDFAPGQMRLASLYVADPERIAQAYDLAVKARKALPDDAELAQVFAEINFRKKEYAYAVQLFQESARKRPLSPKYLYYLGMSHVQARQKAEGQEVLQRAIDAGLPEPLAADAKRALAEIQK